MPYRGPSPSPQAVANYPGALAQILGQTGLSSSYPSSSPNFSFPTPQVNSGGYAGGILAQNSGSSFSSNQRPTDQLGLAHTHRSSSSVSSFSQISALEAYVQNRDDARPFSIAPGGGTSYGSTPEPGLDRILSNSSSRDVTAPAIFRPELIPFAPIIPKPPPGQPPILTASLPTIESLSVAAQSVATIDNPARKIAWSHQVLNLLDRMRNTEQALNPEVTTSTSTAMQNESLMAIVDQAVRQVVLLANDVISYAGTNIPLPSYIPEALYLKGTLEQSGLFPHLVLKDLRQAFKDFEVAARNGFHAGWFKIGRDYESVNDWRRAKEGFERGVVAGEKNCLYVSSIALLYLQRNTRLMSVGR